MTRGLKNEKITEYTTVTTYCTTLVRIGQFCLVFKHRGKQAYADIRSIYFVYLPDSTPLIWQGRRAFAALTIKLPMYKRFLQFMEDCMKTLPLRDIPGGWLLMQAACSVLRTNKNFAGENDRLCRDKDPKLNVHKLEAWLEKKRQEDERIKKAIIRKYTQK